MKVEIYDSTLREGAQRAGVVFSDYEKEKIIAALDGLGVDFIEMGYYGPSSAAALSGFAGRVKTRHAVLSVLCATRRPGGSADTDETLVSLAASPIKAVAVVGKASLFQVENVLGTDADTNLAMISETVRFLKNAGKTVIFDAEHFFDGWSYGPDYARASVMAAIGAGADRVVLCDTNGGMLPDIIGLATQAIKKTAGGVPVGIHCHNDIGMADACTVSAVLSGASHVQCTVSGIGERCGNANLTTVVPALQLKLGFECIPSENLKTLSPVARSICQTANLGFDESAPFVGGHAFLHKAGLHIDGIRKSRESFEHINPDLVGNSRSLIMSELAGKAAMKELLSKFGFEFAKDSPEPERILNAVRSAEAAGSQFDASEASLYLLVRRTLGKEDAPFVLKDYKLIFSAEAEPECRWSAIVKFDVGGEERLSAGEGDGPVNALDIAAHIALSGKYPYIADVKMVDIKTRIDSNDRAASASIVRAYVEYGDGKNVWRTMGASADIIAASWSALLDAYEYCILMHRENRSDRKF
ncbi:MAG: citramalate synthase [Clostridia bacterium]|nr:citramalate synthase [Clostridia bacterium]